ncbi:MAG: UvrD-helicase domain-containing protein [Myxococcota bacterium]
MSLNPAQQAAVDHRGSPLLVLAGAGTGKTRVITHRVAALLDEGVPAWRILAVTFTNKAAKEMRERIDGLCGGRHDVRELWVGTFHSICARILRRNAEGVGLSSHYAIYDTSDQRSLMKQVLKDLGVPDRLYTPQGVLGHIDRAKNQGLRPNEFDQMRMLEPVATVVRNAYTKYQEKLLAADACDFGDLILHVVTLLRNAVKPSDSQLGDLDPVLRLTTRFTHVVVDEFQDTNPLQAEFVDRMSRAAELCVVGDDDQSIYGWRGADVDQILRFADRHDNTEVVRLEQNYRSTMNILRCSDAVIRKNSGRLGKTLWSDLGDGDPVRCVKLATERDEGRLIAQEAYQAIEEGTDPDQIAIFYRTHAMSRVLEDEVRRMGLSCRIVGGVAFYERQEVKDTLAYLSVLRNSSSDAHVSRIVNRPARGIGNTTQTRLAEAAAKAGTSLWEAMLDPTAAGLKKAAARRVTAFVKIIQGLREEMHDLGLDELVARVVEVSGYREMLVVDDSEESQARLENLQELQGNVMEFLGERPDGTLDDYLELVSLVGGERSEGDPNRAVTLMTVHSAKGLEFERVYVTGMEERVFPHARVLDDPVQMEEERRLAYVALTRAKRHLTLTMAARRRIFGQTQVGVPSRFIGDLPSDSVVRVGNDGYDSGYGGYGRSAHREQPVRRQAESWQNDIEYDIDPDIPFDEVPTEEEEGVPIYVGMMVRTKTFGDAEVIGWSGSGAKMKLQLRLSNREVKTVMARFCQPL